MIVYTVSQKTDTDTVSKHAVRSLLQWIILKKLLYKRRSEWMLFIFFENDENQKCNYLWNLKSMNVVCFESEPSQGLTK